MVHIHLSDLKFFAHHGMHQEETIVGTEFEVSATIGFMETAKIRSIRETVNYIDVFNIIKDHMSNPAVLLETLAMEICDDIYNLDKRIKSITVNINKLNPPIKSFNGHVGVSYSKEY